MYRLVSLSMRGDDEKELVTGSHAVVFRAWKRKVEKASIPRTRIYVIFDNNDNIVDAG